MLERFDFRDHCPIQGNVFLRQDGDTQKRWYIPSEWYGSYVLFQAFGSPLWILFGKSGVTVNPAQESSDDGEDLTASSLTGDRIMTNTVARFFIPVENFYWQACGSFQVRASLSHFAVESEDATGGWIAQAVSENHMCWLDAE